MTGERCFLSEPLRFGVCNRAELITVSNEGIALPYVPTSLSLNRFTKAHEVSHLSFCLRPQTPGATGEPEARLRLPRRLGWRFAPSTPSAPNSSHKLGCAFRWPLASYVSDFASALASAAPRLLSPIARVWGGGHRPLAFAALKYRVD